MVITRSRLATAAAFAALTAAGCMRPTEEAVAERQDDGAKILVFDMRNRVCVPNTDEGKPLGYSGFPRCTYWFKCRIRQVEIEPDSASVVAFNDSFVCEWVEDVADVDLPIKNNQRIKVVYDENAFPLEPSHKGQSVYLGITPDIKLFDLHFPAG